MGDSYDNGLAEAVNGLYQAELIYSQSAWVGLAEMESTTMDWVHWWNTKRLHEYLGYRTPAEVEVECYDHHRREETLATV